MITFEQARQIVYAALRPDYPAIADFSVSASGLENADEYQVIPVVGSREYLAPEGVAHIVNKVTGEYTQKYGVGRVIDNGTPCGEPEENDEP